MIRSIIENWCKTNSLTIADAHALLEEYFSYSGRKMTGDDFQTIVEASRHFPIDWDMIITQIVLRNHWTLMRVESKPDSRGYRYLINRYLYE